MRTFVKLVGSACLLGAFLTSPLAQAQVIEVTKTWDFDTEPTDLFISGNNDETWLGTGGNPDSGGFLIITWPEGSQSTAIVFPDPSEGVDGNIIESFTFECDLRVGNSTGDRAADGFSLSLARANDPLLVDPENINNGDFAGGIPEGGATTGVAVSFDTWDGNALPDSADIEGIIVRVDNKTILRESLPTRHGECDDITSLQTGPRNQQYWDDGGLTRDPESWAELCWQPILIDVTKAGDVTVAWKGNTILDGFETGWLQGRGQLILAGRTGAANEHTHIDNLKLTANIIKVEIDEVPTPQNLQAPLVGAGAVQLTWDEVVDSDQPDRRFGYQVLQDGTALPVVTDTELIVGDLMTETTYSFSVIATDILGEESDPSDAVEVTTILPVESEDGWLMGTIYDGVGGVSISDGLADPNYPDNPSRVVFMNGLDFDGYGDNYFIVISGTWTPPEGGETDIFLRSDDASQFYINLDSASIPEVDDINWEIAEDGCCNAFLEPDDPVMLFQTTFVPLNLTADKEMGFTFAVKEGGGGDFGQVAWRLVGDDTPAADLPPMQGPQLKGMSDPTGAEVEIVTQPEGGFVEGGTTAELTVEADTFSLYEGPFYQWYKDDQPIAGATAATYLIPEAQPSDSGDYTVSVAVMGLAVMSEAATLEVGVDEKAPEIESAGALADTTSVGLAFNEQLDVASAETASNYTVSGTTVSAAAVYGADEKIVRLTTAGTPADGFTVTATGVEDTKGNATDGATATGELVDMIAMDVMASDTDPVTPGDAFAIGGGGFYVIGGGHDIWDAADAFQFVYKEFTGPMEIVTRVASLEGTHSWAKATIMVRETLEGGSREHAVATTTTAGQNIRTVQWRDETDAGSGSKPGEEREGPVPYPDAWLKMVRESADSNLFKSYIGEDGVNWRLYHEHEILGDILPATLFVGMGVTSHDNAPDVLADAVYDAFSVAPFSGGGEENLTIGLVDGDVVISWDAGTLVSSVEVNGEYTPVDGATSPYTVTPTEAAVFYQVQQ